MPDVKYKGPGPAERINNRLRNSGAPDADVKTHHGTGPTRVFHNIHHAAGHHGGSAEGGNVRLQDQGDKR